MVLTILLLVVLLAPMLWVTVRGKDAWPFSHYPMFSRLTNLSEVEVFRLALETKEGEIVWWHSEFYRYPEFVGRMLKQLHRRECESGRTAAFAALERQRYLAEVLNLIEAEEGAVEHYAALRIVRRTVDPHSAGPHIEDETIARVAIGEIKRLRRAN